MTTNMGTSILINVPRHDGTQLKAIVNQSSSLTPASFFIFTLSSCTAAISCDNVPFSASSEDFRFSNLTMKVATRIKLAFLLLLVASSATSSYSHCKPPAGEKGYPKFLRQHLDYPKTSGSNDYCETMMHKRCLTNLDPPKAKCKETNTFIHITKALLQIECIKSGSPYGNYQRISHGRYTVTTCKIKGNATVHPCEYKASTETKKIIIACENKLPAYYEEGEAVPK